MFRAKADAFGRELAAYPVARAFAISLMLHFVLIGGVELGREAGLWKHSLLPQSSKSRLQEEVAKAEKQFQEQARQAPQNQVPEAQLVFVEVDPSAAIPEPPKDSKFYSSQSTVASNPDVSDKEMPKIEGQQDKIVKTFDTLKPDPRSLEPKPAEPKPEVKSAETKPPPETQPEPKPAQPQPTRPTPPEEEPKPTREQQPGETLLARAAPQPRQPAPQPEVKPEPRRPRTLVEAKAQKGIIEGQKMRQDGGARKARLDSSFDVRGTPFGAYDQEFIRAVQSRWFNLLDERDFVGGQAGKVVLEFRLNYDGRITSLRVAETEVNEILGWLCQRAVLDPSPYRPFPSDMRRIVNNDFRDIRFTFYYNQ